MKKGVFILLSIVFCSALFGEQCIVDGIYYDIDFRSEATVIAGQEKYKGDITIPASFYTTEGHYCVVRKIGSYAFQNCTDLTSVSIPSTIYSIGQSSFSGCGKVSTIYVPSSVSIINSIAFGSVNNVAFSGTGRDATSTSPWAAKCVNGNVAGHFVYRNDTLFGCYADAEGEIEIPKKYTIIHNKAFYLCDSITSVILPSSVLRIEAEAFKDCKNLTSITMGDSIKYIGHKSFANCKLLTSILFSNSLQVIGDEAFLNCKSIKALEFPTSILQIQTSAFENCTGISSLNIPNSITSIQNTAFASCEKLYDVTVEWNEEKQLPRLGLRVFSYIAGGMGPSNATLHVPVGTKSIYAAADQWKDFGVIAEYEPTALPKTKTIETQTTKVLRNGQVVLINANSHFSILGHEIR